MLASQFAMVVFAMADSITAWTWESSKHISGIEVSKVIGQPKAEECNETSEGTAQTIPDNKSPLEEWHVDT